jgi:hypothetical protein
MANQVDIHHTGGCINEEAVAALCTTLLLLLVHFCPKSHCLSVAMYEVKMTEQPQIWLPAV